MISKRTKYGIKALACIARSGDLKPIQTYVIAERENISLKYLESILIEMRKNGLLASKKGKGGGYYLLKPANEIKMTHVMRVLEGPIAMVPCVSLNYYEKCDDCPDEISCSVNKLMIQVRDNMLAIYRNTYLSDLI
ncbi:MAG: Rrf2 family transcriptional regulator [Crocinitomix sp.]|nr:Rrf2 family transcriptional regulator [Crocinitomix sp.]